MLRGWSTGTAAAMMARLSSPPSGNPMKALTRISVMLLRVIVGYRGGAGSQQQVRAKDSDKSHFPPHRNHLASAVSLAAAFT